MSKASSPYSSFGTYNKIDESQKQEKLKEAQLQQQLQQQQMQQHYQGQQMQQPTQQQMQQPTQQPTQQPVQGQTRFKHIQSVEHLQNILSNGVEHFQTNFKSKGINPPPMRLFLKLYTEWCGPCKAISPILDEISLSSDTREILFMKFDADLIIKNQDPLSKQLVKYLNIGAVPAFYGFIDGKLVGSVMGAERSEIDQLLQKLLQ